MSWLGLRHKGTERLYSDEWNLVVDGLDILYYRDQELKEEIDCLEAKVDQIYNFTKPPTKLETYTRSVSTTPTPLSDVDKKVKRIHVKLPSWEAYLVYLGNETKQEFVLEVGDKEVLEIENPRTVYAKSLGNVTIYVMLEC